MQIKKLSILFYFISGMLVFQLSGCTTALEKAHWKLVEHPRILVSYPARLGSTAGQIVGFPVTVVMLPFALTVGRKASADDAGKVWMGFYPFVACRDTGAILVGAVPWLLFGWWGNTDPPQKMPETETVKPPSSG